MKSLSYITLFFLVVTFISGCGENEDPLEIMKPTSTANVGPLATMKVPQAVAGAPAAPTLPAGTPFVKSVGYYRDWKRTKPLTGIVKPGATIHIKIVFSEGMKFVVADDKSARPILYHWINGDLTRFNIAPFGAKGENFASGDCKPVGSQAVYFGKYTVKATDFGRFTVAVGKLNTDRQGNTMSAFYGHKQWLLLGQAVGESETPPSDTPKVEKPTDASEQPTETGVPTILSIMHYHNNTPMAEGDTVPEGTTIETQVTFSERVTPAIIYTTGGKTKAYNLSWQIGGVHWRGTCKPMDNSGTTWLCRQSVSAPSFSVTVTAETTNSAGGHLAEEGTSPTIAVTARPATQSTLQEPSAQLTPGGDIALYRLVDKKISNTYRAKSAQLLHNGVDFYFDNRPINVFYAAEFGITFSAQTLADISQIYREIFPHKWKQTRERAKLMEYFKLQLQHPEKNEKEVLGLYTESVKNGTVDYIDNELLEGPKQQPNPADDIALYRLTDEKIWKALHARQAARNKGDFRPSQVFFEQEFGVDFSSTTDVEINQIYRKIFPSKWKKISGHAELMEYFKLQLQHPEKNEQEVLELYTESVKNGIVEYIHNEFLDETKMHMREDL